MQVHARRWLALGGSGLLQRRACELGRALVGNQWLTPFISTNV
jgi:hypothetical protein